MNLLPFEDGEKIASVISCREFPDDEYLLFATKSGMVKKTVMSAYDRSRRDGIIAINLKAGDALLDVRRVREGDRVIMATTEGKAIMFEEDQVRATGRDTSGVLGSPHEGRRASARHGDLQRARATSLSSRKRALVSAPRWRTIRCRTVAARACTPSR